MPAVGMGALKPASATQLLLDKLSTPVNMAYSTRKIRSGYGGAALVASDATTITSGSDVGFSGGNLDAVGLAAICTSGNGGILHWYDQSVNGNNTSLITAGNFNGFAPTIYLSHSTPSINGHAAVLASTSGSFGTSPLLEIFNSSGSYFSFTPPFTIAAAFKLTSATANTNIVGDGDFGSGDIQLFAGGGGQVYQLWGAGGVHIQSVSSITDTNVHGIFGIHNGASSSIIVDGVSVASSGGNLGSSTVADLNIFDTNANCSLGELIIFSGVLSVPDQATVLADWAYWGVP